MRAFLHIVFCLCRAEKPVAIVAAGVLATCGFLPKTTSAADVVKVSDFGWDAADSTRHVQAALDSGARRVIFDRVSGPWVVTPVEARSDTEIIFEEGVELRAKEGAFLGRHDCLMSFIGVTNVTLVGLGEKGGALRMRKLDYRRSPYEPSLPR